MCLIILYGMLDLIMKTNQQKEDKMSKKVKTYRLVITGETSIKAKSEDQAEALFLDKTNLNNCMIDVQECEDQVQSEVNK